MSINRYVHTAVARGHAVMKDIVTIPYSAVHQLAVLYKTRAAFEQRHGRWDLGSVSSDVVTKSGGCFYMMPTPRCASWRCCTRRSPPLTAGWDSGSNPVPFLLQRVWLVSLKRCYRGVQRLGVPLEKTKQQTTRRCGRWGRDWTSRSDRFDVRLNRQ